MPDVSYPSIPDPNLDLGAILNTVNRLKETVELITGQTKDKRFSFPNQVKIVERRSAEGSARFTEQLQIQANSLESVAHRTTDLETNLGTTNANVSAEALARSTADTALALSITSVSAVANGATASGTIYLVAEVAPSGYTAQYGWQLTAGSHSIGMKALVDGAGNGYISFVANQFRLIDPSYSSGTPTVVFNYNGTTFNFNVPVTVRNQEIGAHAVSNQSSAVGNITSGASLSTTLTTLASTRLLVVVSVSDNTSSSVRTSSVGVISPILRQYDLYVDGSIWSGASLFAYDQLIASSFVGGVGGNAWQFQAAMSSVSDSFLVTGLAAGSHSFTVVNPNSFQTRMTITVTELRDG